MCARHRPRAPTLPGLYQRPTKHSDARLFADDCLLYRHVMSSQDRALLQEDSSTLERWEETRQMKFHPDKCMVIRISTNRKQILKTNYQIHAHTLGVVDSSKCISVTISEDRTWKKHIDNTVIRRNLGDCTAPAKAAAARPGAKYFEKYSNTLQLLKLINYYNYITITGPVEM